MHQTSATWSRGLIFLILAQIMVGVNIVSSKVLLSSIPIFFLMAMRFTLATLTLLPLHWVSPAKKLSLHHYFSRLNKRDWLFIFAQAACAGILFNCFMLLGLHYTDANVAGIITSSLPAIIALLSWIFLKEKIVGKQSVSIIFATIGLLVIAYGKIREGEAIHSFLGDFLILVSLFPEAGYYVLCKVHLNNLPPFLTSALMNGVNAILLLPFGLYALWSSPTELSVEVWLILFILGLSSGLFFVFYYFGCRLVDGILISLSTAVMPIATVLLAWLILSEQLSIWEGLGMAMVVLSIIIYAKR